MEAIKEEASQTDEVTSKQYPESWIDRLTAWASRLPGRSWLPYFLLSAVLFIVLTGTYWIESGDVLTTPLPIHVFFSILIPFLLSFIYYLDEMAGRSLESFRPVLISDEIEYDFLYFRITTIPAAPAFLAGLAMFIFMILVDVLFGLPTAVLELIDFPVSFAFLNAVYKICTFVFGTFIFHTIHQLRWVNRIYKRYTRIDLFNLGPLYAFSRLTALTSGGIILILYLWLVVNPGTITDILALGLSSIFVIIALFTFIWPLRSAHGLLKTEKERLLNDCSANFRTLSQELHRRIQSHDLEGIGQINAAMGGLETERTAIKRISTWPWQPETLRTLISSTLAPIAIWLLQYFFRIWFGGNP